MVAGEVRELRGGVLQATSSMKSSSSLREFAVWERVKATRRPHLLHWGNSASQRANQKAFTAENAEVTKVVDMY